MDRVDQNRHQHPLYKLLNFYLVFFLFFMLALEWLVLSWLIFKIVYYSINYSMFFFKANDISLLNRKKPNQFFKLFKEFNRETLPGLIWLKQIEVLLSRRLFSQNA